MHYVLSLQIISRLDKMKLLLKFLVDLKICALPKNQVKPEKTVNAGEKLFSHDFKPYIFRSNRGHVLGIKKINFYEI